MAQTYAPGEAFFKGMAPAQRIAFRNEWMSIGAAHGVKLISRSVRKKRYLQWLAEKFGAGILINPHIVAFALVSRCVNSYLRSLSESALGIFISDENKEIVADIEKSISLLRVLEGSRRLSQIVEKGFFIDSAKSLPLQLCDLFTISLRKHAERVRHAGAHKSFDDTGIELASRLTYVNHQDDQDVLAWLEEEYNAQKK